MSNTNNTEINTDSAKVYSAFSSLVHKGVMPNNLTDDEIAAVQKLQLSYATEIAINIFDSAIAFHDHNARMSAIEAQHDSAPMRYMSDKQWLYHNNRRYFAANYIREYTKGFMDVMRERYINTAINRIIKAIEYAGCAYDNQQIDLAAIIALAPNICQKEISRCASMKNESKPRG